MRKMTPAFVAGYVWAMEHVTPSQAIIASRDWWMGWHTANKVRRSDPDLPWKP